MSAEPGRLTLTRLAILGTGAVVIFAGLHAMAALVSQTFMALVIVLTWLPALHWFEKKGLPRWAGYLIATFGTLAILGGLVVFFGVTAAQFASQVPAYQEQLAAQSAALQSQLAARGIDASALAAAGEQLARQILALVASFMLGLLGILGSIVLLILVFVFMLLELSTFPARLRAALGPDNPYLATVSAFARSITTYMVVRVWLGLLAATGDIILLWVLDVPYVILWGVLSFVGSFIPYLGYWIALIPPLVLALILHGPSTALVVLLGYWLINGVTDSVIGPRVMGKSLDLSPVLTILVVFLWGWVLGPVGAILAVPLTMVVKLLVLDPFPDGRRLATLMSMEVEPDSETSLPSSEAVRPGKTN